MSIFHRRANVAVPSEPVKTPGTSSEATDPGVLITCKKCSHKHRITIRAGRAKGGTFAMCPKCSSGGIYDEYGQAFNPAQFVAEELIRKYR